MTVLPVPAARSGQLATLDQLAAIPEEEIWLTKQKSPPTRRAYRLHVRSGVGRAPPPRRAFQLVQASGETRGGEPHGSGLGTVRCAVEHANAWLLANKRLDRRNDRLTIIIDALLTTA